MAAKVLGAKIAHRCSALSTRFSAAQVIRRKPRILLGSKTVGSAVILQHGKHSTTISVH